MSELNKSYRIKANVGGDSNISLMLNQDYNVLEVLSIKINQEDTYKIHSANYGVIVGRVLANNGFGVPNAKLSIFIEGEFSSVEDTALYPFSSTASRDGNGTRYNLLVDKKVDDCHQVVGTFPNKTYLLDNNDLIEIFDKYYKYTTRTNNSGDYLICGVPVGNHTLHMDLDLSDCGILSQRPRDFVYKGYTIEQFENPNQFKTDTELDVLSQVFSQDQTVNVIPFWGEENNGQEIGITRADVNVKFKFEPTCVFMGSLVADNASNGISKKCVPTNQMGAMDELTTGEGTIEMIRKTMSDDVEEFQIKGTQLIDGNGVWCYQIPMNLDYMMTDEYGNTVPTDDPERGIPTRARVRFRISMQDNEMNTDNYFRAKVLVPHNPQDTVEGHEEYDYEFGSYTKDESFRDLFWNNVYTVKSYIPRIQKSQVTRSERFTGIKHCNIYGNNNPMPYNNIRIRLPLMFTILCALIKSYIRIVRWINTILDFFIFCFGQISTAGDGVTFGMASKFVHLVENSKFITLADGLCPDLENWYFAPSNSNKTIYYDWGKDTKATTMLKLTFNSLIYDNAADTTAIDTTNSSNNTQSICLTSSIDYLVSCIEMNLAQEYKVINFDFYNDWVNGVIYMPRWMKFIRKKRSFLFGLITIKSKVKACMDDSTIFGKTRRYTQQCSLQYKRANNKPYTEVITDLGCDEKNKNKTTQKCHKNQGMNQYSIFGSGNRSQKGNGGAVHETKTMKDQYVYYFKPCEWGLTDNKKTILFANDIILLGSLNDCNLYGLPQAFKHLTSSSYIMPTNLALTNMDDDGYLYADNNGTICSRTTLDENLSVKKVETSFSSTSKYYSTAQDETVQYGVDSEGNAVNDDTIPLTEAAGIAWNYTGPGQGTANFSKRNNTIYQPGGHFLGISCVNSETNIKSCINLQRICEAGATMSQRREEVRQVSMENGSPKLSYRYFIPTGLISQDEVLDGDFRTMFATMNHRRLLCGDKVDEQTGYPIYDFLYLRGNGFDGKMNKQVTATTEYNKKVDVNDEYSWMQGQGNLKSDDYDNAEKGETYAKTLENVNSDYYMFRMGLDTLKSEQQDKKFLIISNGASMPQYENSYYFYFGLKDGATALDEFNKQFFSVCETDSSIINTPAVNAVGNVESGSCLTGDITVMGRFVETPIRVTLSRTDGTLIDSVTTQNDYHIFEDIPFGNYTVNLVDANEVELSTSVILGSNVMEVNYETSDFSFRTRGMDIGDITDKASETQSGLFKVRNKIQVGEDTYILSTALTDFAIALVNTTPKDGKIEYMHYPTGTNVPIDESLLYNEDKQRVYTGSDITNSIQGITQTAGENGTTTIPMWRSESNYSLYIYLTCGSSWKYTQHSNFSVNGIDAYDLYLGSKLLPYSEKLVGLSDKWWDSIGDDSTNIDNWAMRHALFRQTDDSGEEFENKIYALNENDKEIDTALFGQPEQFIGGVPVPYSKDGKTIWYEGDNAFEGDLSDESILPTWPTGTTSRAHFSEMAYYKGLVISDSIGKATITNSTTGRADSICITISKTMSSIAANDACIIKLNDGNVIYAVKVSDKKYEYYGETYSNGTELEFHPVFKYPVMDRPFYANMNFLIWNIATLDAEIDEETQSTTFVTVDGLGWRMDKCKVHNGITYQKNFNQVLINGLSAITINGAVTPYASIIRRPVSETDIKEECIISASIDINRIDENLNDNVSFYIEEGVPGSVLDKTSDVYQKINKPRKFESASIEGSVSFGDMENEIRYYRNGDAFTFSGSSTMDYYLFNATTTSVGYVEQPLGVGDVVSYLMPDFSYSTLHFAVKGRINSTGVGIDSRNVLNETIICECQKDIYNSKIFNIVFSIYSGSTIKSKITVKCENKYDAITATTPYEVLDYEFDKFYGGKEDIEDMGYTTIDYLSEYCGIDICMSYTYDRANPPTGYTCWLDYYKKEIGDGNAYKIKMGETHRFLMIDDSSFAIAMASNTSGAQGDINVLKIYPELKEIKKL